MRNPFAAVGRCLAEPQFRRPTLGFPAGPRGSGHTMPWRPHACDLRPCRWKLCPTTNKVLTTQLGNQYVAYPCRVTYYWCLDFAKVLRYKNHSQYSRRRRASWTVYASIVPPFAAVQTTSNSLRERMLTSCLIVTVMVFAVVMMMKEFSANERVFSLWLTQIFFVFVLFTAQ